MPLARLPLYKIGNQHSQERLKVRKVQEFDTERMQETIKELENSHSKIKKTIFEEEVMKTEYENTGFDEFISGNDPMASSIYV